MRVLHHTGLKKLIFTKNIPVSTDPFSKTIQTTPRPIHSYRHTMTPNVPGPIRTPGSGKALGVGHSTNTLYSGKNPLRISGSANVPSFSCLIAIDVETFGKVRRAFQVSGRCEKGMFNISGLSDDSGRGGKCDTYLPSQQGVISSRPSPQGGCSSSRFPQQESSAPPQVHSPLSMSFP